MWVRSLRTYLTQWHSLYFQAFLSLKTLCKQGQFFSVYLNGIIHYFTIEFKTNIVKTIGFERSIELSFRIVHNYNTPLNQDSQKSGINNCIRLSKFLCYNFWELLGSNSERLLTGSFPILFRVSVIHLKGCE